MNRGLKGLLSLFLIACAIPAASAYTSQQLTSAQYLNTLGLFNGVGKNNDGTQNFNLDAKPTRDEAITILFFANQSNEHGNCFISGWFCI